MKNRYFWAIFFLLSIISVVGAGYYWRDLIIDSEANGIGGLSSEVRSSIDGQEEIESLIDIVPAENLVGTLDAVGTVQLMEQRHVVLKADGEIVSIFVKVGDVVQAGDRLMAINMEELEIEFRQAEINFEIALIEFEELGQESQANNLAVATANLRQAEEELNELKMGTAPDALLAAQSDVLSAWARYNELLAGPSGAAVTEALAKLKKAEVDLQEAQRAYDAIRWLPESGATAQAQNLQRATIDYEAVKAAFEQVNKPTTQSELQAALSQAYSAENMLNEIEAKPSPGELAAAEAQVAQATTELARLRTGIVDADLLLAELKVEQALIDIHIANTRLTNAQIVAPSGGTVLDIHSELGELLSAGSLVVTLADLSQLSLTVDVSELDILQVTIGQSVTVSVDALPDQPIIGTVEQIRPNSITEQGVVNYPVTIRLANDKPAQILPGMTAVATLNSRAIANNSWLVPTSSVEENAGNNVMSIVRGEERINVPVDLGEIRGEWTIIRSDDLQLGDQVWGVVTSFVDRDAQRLFGG